MTKDIRVFICEDEDVGREIVGKYMVPGKVTFVSLFKEEQRQAIKDALEHVI